MSDTCICIHLGRYVIKQIASFPATQWLYFVLNYVSIKLLYLYSFEHFSVCFLQYVSRSIPGPGCSIEEFDAKYEGCWCKTQSCSPDNCPCISRFGLAYSKERTILQIEPFKENIDQRTKFCSPILECGPRCLCSSACLNRLIQHGLKYKTEVFDAPSNKGFGLRALEFIQKGTFLCEYAGEIIDLQEAQRRTALLQARKGMNYILVLREHYGNKTAEICIDPKNFGNLGRFINHSCDPNLSMTAVRYSNAIPKLCLFARRDINVGEELTFHYGGLEQMVPGDRFHNRLTEKICHCASENCSGYLPFDKYLFDTIWRVTAIFSNFTKIRIFFFFIKYLFYWKVKKIIWKIFFVIFI